MKLEIIEPGTIYHTRNYGDACVIEDLGRIDKKHYVTIEFIDTGSIKTVELYELKHGNVKDDSVPCKRLIFDPNEIHHSNNYGDFKIIEDLGFLKYAVRYVKIRFVDTNYESVVIYNNAKIGNVKDIMRPMVYGVGCIGTEDVLEANSIDKILYHRWINMLSRCYNENDVNYNAYGAIGVKVDNEWLNYNNYRNDVKLIHGYNLFESNPTMYHLDKDYLQLTILHNKRIYSKYTCVWMNRSCNAALINTRAVLPGIIERYRLYFTKVYDYVSCSLVEYGPFYYIEEAITALNTSYMLQNYYYGNLKTMCTIVN